MNLSDTDKNKIIELIKAGENLPKEYIYKLFADEEDVFLFWNGRKEDITNVALPFHSIEHIDEPRKENKTVGQSFDLFDTRGRQLIGWTNKLIWGDNKLILSSLANGPLKEEIEKVGGIKLIYIDPPFAVGADFSFDIQIGEETGKLVEVLQDLARFYQNKIKQRRKIVSSLTYPCVVLTTSLGAVFFMLKFVVPMFGDVFKRFGGKLPWLTEKIIGISQGMENNFWRVFIVFMLVAAFLFSTRKTQRFRELASKFLLKIPIAGNLVQKIYLARFCNSMRLLINAHLPLLRAIALCRQHPRR